MIVAAASMLFSDGRKSTRLCVVFQESSIDSGSICVCVCMYVFLRRFVIYSTICASVISVLRKALNIVHVQHHIIWKSSSISPFGHRKSWRWNSFCGTEELYLCHRVPTLWLIKILIVLQHFFAHTQSNIQFAHIYFNARLFFDIFFHRFPATVLTLDRWFHRHAYLIFLSKFTNGVTNTLFGKCKCCVFFSSSFLLVRKS